MAQSLPALADLEAWIFDMDATLTVGKHDFEAIRKELGLPADQSILESIAALPLREQVPLREALADWEWDIARQTEPAPGALALLTQLRDAGCPLAILTRNRKDIAMHTLQAAGLEAFFAPDTVLGRDCAAPKPSPDGIFRIFERWGRRPARVAMVGDYLFDLQAGRAANCLTVHVSPQPRPDWASEIDVFVPDLKALMGKLESADRQGT